MSDFEIHQEFLPGGTCGTCRGEFSLLTGAVKNPTGRTANLLKDNDYCGIIEELSSLPRGTEANTECQCVVCQYGKSKVSDKLKGGRKQKEISEGKSRDNRSLIEPRADKIDRLMKEWTPKTKSGLAHALIKEKQEETSSESTITFTSAAGGSSLPVFVGAKTKRKLDYKQEPINNEIFKQMQINEGLSDKSVRRIQTVVRESMGHSSVQTGLREELSDDPKVLEKYFKTEMLPFEVRNEDSGETETVNKKICYSKDLPGFKEFVKESRNYTNEPDLKVGIDGGGGSFKVTLNMTEKKQQTADDVKSPPKKRTAKHIKKRHKDSGVKKLFIIAIVEGILETYDNVKSILKLLGLENIDFVIATDLKLANILLGLSNHASRHRCPYCTIPHGEFNCPNRRPLEENLRTLGDIRNSHRAFLDHCNRKYPNNPKEGLKDAKDFDNCINMPLFSLPDETLIMDIIPLPELHLMLGCVNNILKELNKRWGERHNIEDPVWKFCDEHNIKKITYRGKSLEGPSCEKLFKKLHLLDRRVPPRLRTFVSALFTFDALKKSCFSDVVQEDFEKQSRAFKFCFELLNFDSGSTKIHIVLDHLDQFVKRKGALGPYSEQASESVHADWIKTWELYKSYPGDDRLMKCVLKYNKKHI